MCLLEKLSEPGFQSILALKRVLGAGENELEPVQCLAFLSVAITKDPQRHRESNEVRGPSWLFYAGLLSHPWTLAIFTTFIAVFCSSSQAVAALTFPLELLNV